MMNPLETFQFSFLSLIYFFIQQVVPVYAEVLRMVPGLGHMMGADRDGRCIKVREKWEAVRSHGALLAVQSKEIAIFSQGSGEITRFKAGEEL